jgi:DTW domain-containing protein
MGQHRRRIQGRCPRCRVLLEDCVCALIPAVSTQSRVLIVMHAREEAQLSNTGRLAHFALPNSRIALRGLPHQPVDVNELEEPATRGLLLFPDPGVPALSIDDRPAPGERLCLVVPDAGWRQAKRIARRERPLGALPWRTLSTTAESRYHLRRAPQAGHLSTFEAIAEALAVLEEDGPAIRDELMAFFDEWVARNLWERRGHCPKRG